MSVQTFTTTTAALIDQAEARAAQSIRTNMVVDTVEAAATLDEALADVRHYHEQRTTAAEVLRRRPIYGPHKARSFFADLLAFNTDTNARTRIGASQKESYELAGLEGRAVNTAGFAGLIPPTYMVEMLAPALRASMPTVDAIAYPMPGNLDNTTSGGMSVIIPKFTTGAAGASQSAENAAVTTTDVVAANVTANVVTITASTTLSMQMLQRSGPSFDLFIARELFGALNAETERQLLTGSGASGQATGILNAAGTASVTYTSATPTAATALPKIGAAISSSASTYLRTAPDVIVSHPRFLSWLATVGETIRPPLEWTAFTGRPISSGAMPSNLGAGTNETRLIAFPREAIACFITDPVIDVANDTAGLLPNMSATVTARRYLAIGYVWPSAITILGGTGMAAAAT